MYRCKMRLISGQCANSPLFRRSVKWPLLPIHLKPRTSNWRTCILLNVRQSNRKPVQRKFRHSSAISSNHKTVLCNFERGGRDRTGPPDSSYCLMSGQKLEVLDFIMRNKTLQSCWMERHNNGKIVHIMCRLTLH